MVERFDRLSADSGEISILKRELHRNCNGYMEAALENKYWIEAICIAESLMADRIESYFLKHFGSRKITTLGRWVFELLKTESISDRDRKLFIRVKAWADSRNKAVHELVKVSESNIKPWHERLEALESTAWTGKQLAAEVKNWSRRNP